MSLQAGIFSPRSPGGQVAAAVSSPRVANFLPKLSCSVLGHYLQQPFQQELIKEFARPSALAKKCWQR